MQIVSWVNASTDKVRLGIGLSSADSSTGYSSAQDSISINLQADNDGSERVYTDWANGGSMENGQVRTSSDFTATQYYVELIRTSSSTFTMQFYSDSTYTTTVSGINASRTGVSNVTGLRYFVVKNYTDASTDGNIVLKISDLQFWNGVSSLTSKPTNVQSGSRFEETDTRKIYYAGGMSKSGIKSYYNFEQTSGSLTNQATTANGFTDGLGSSADGTVQNITQNTTGKLGSYAYTFNGTTSSSKITLGSSYSQFVFLRSANSTISLWLKKAETSTTSFRTIFAEHYGAGGQSGIRIAVLNNKFNIVVYNSGSNVVVSTTDFDYPQNTDWHHIVIKFDYTNSLMTVYVDGSSLGTKALGSTSSGNSSLYASLGDDQGGDGNWYGDMDDLTLFSRALTSDEVSYLYNSGTGRTVNSTDMLGWTEEA